MNHVQWIFKHVVALASVLTIPVVSRGAEDFSAAVRSSGVQGGVVVLVNCGDTATIESIAGNSTFLVHCLEQDPAAIGKVREELLSKNLYGRVSAMQFDGKSLPYADNSINLVVADPPGSLPEAEALRVLRPLGVLVVGGKSIVKPWPNEIDDWPQYLNKADNNAVAMDSVIGPPRHLQWSGTPVWSRSHMAISTMVSLVTGNGRMFTIEDRGVTANPFMPTEFNIVARDAFNGRDLWRKRIAKWESITTYIKCLPVQQQRRMAVAGDVLYCTFELEGAVSAVDAATGTILKTFENTSPCQEVAYDQGILFLNVGQRFPSAAYNIVKIKGGEYGPSTPGEPFEGSGFREGYDPEIEDADNPKSVIMAIDPATGKRLWTTGKLNTYTAASFAVKGNNAVYQTADGLFCVNARTGKENWGVKKSIGNEQGADSRTPGTMPNTVVITADAVFAVETAKKPTINAYALKDGKILWTAPIQSNYESSCDVFYIDGVLWVGGKGEPTAYDAKTGKALESIKQRMNKPMGHDRCYRNMITEKYYINSKTGGADFLDLATGNEFPNHWTRGTCGMGVLPANGMLYSTPYSCNCSPATMFPGLNAYSSVPDLKTAAQPVPVQRSPRLEKGVAFGGAGSGPKITDADWITYRCDSSRGSVSKAVIPATLNPQWKTKLPGLPTAATSVGNQAYVCDADAHALYVLEAGSGKIVWRFIADGRIDSPPTFHNGMLLFGSNDGWVYCVRAFDGVLAWRFKDLPDRLIHIRGQLESTWPVSGSVLVMNDKLYYTAGRSTFLDGGIFLYCLEPATGKVLKSRNIYGPFEESTGFPVADKGSSPEGGFRNEILVAKNGKLYLRQRAFDQDLNDVNADDPHIMVLSGFLDPNRQYREGWIVDTQIDWWQQGTMNILIAEEQNIYGVQGFPMFNNHSYFDVRQSSYKLIKKSANEMFAKSGKRRKKMKSGDLKETDSTGWTVDIPIAGRAIAKAGKVIYLAGEPMKFNDLSYKNYLAAYKGELGGRILAVSAVDGKTLAEYKLDAAPVWDSLCVANGRLFISQEDGSVQCFAGQ